MATQIIYHTVKVEVIIVETIKDEGTGDEERSLKVQTVVVGGENARETDAVGRAETGSWEIYSRDDRGFSLYVVSEEY